MDEFKNNKTLSRRELAGLEALDQICDLSIGKFNRTLPKSVNYASQFLKISNDFAELSSANVANSDFFPFLHEFQEIITDEGLCYTSNMLEFKDLYTRTITTSLRYPKHEDLSNWTVFGYENANDPMAYPKRILGSGRKAGFSLMLKMRQQDVDYTCKGAINGFRILLHTPDEIPQIDSHFYRVPFGVETMISVTPRAITTSDNLKGYKPFKRQCFFNGERRLVFSKIYTQANCKLECLAGKLKLIH